MGRGNQDRIAFQRALQANGNKGWASANVVKDIKRERRTRDQPPPTLPNVDVHGILLIARRPAGHTTDCGGRDAWFKEAKCNAEKSATAAFEQVLASAPYR